MLFATMMSAGAEAVDTFQLELGNATDYVLGYILYSNPDGTYTKNIY